MTDTVTLTFTMHTNKIRSECSTTVDTGIAPGDWAELSEDERDAHATDVFMDTAMASLGGWGWTADTDDTKD